MVRKCTISGRKEKCLLKNRYPITKNGKISKKRIKAAASYGSSIFGRLKKAGICRLAKRKGVKLKKCMR